MGACVMEISYSSGCCDDKGVPLNLAFVLGSGGLNSGPLACEAAIFTC